MAVQQRTAALMLCIDQTLAPTDKIHFDAIAIMQVTRFTLGVSAMNIPVSVSECEQIGRFHYLLASGHYTGDGQMTALEKKEFFVDARHWFERAYIYGGSEFSRRYTRICEEHIAELSKRCRPPPALYAVQS